MVLRGSAVHMGLLIVADVLVAAKVQPIYLLAPRFT